MSYPHHTVNTAASQSIQDPLTGLLRLVNGAQSALILVVFSLLIIGTGSG